MVCGLSCPLLRGSSDLLKHYCWKSWILLSGGMCQKIPNSNTLNNFGYTSYRCNPQDLLGTVSCITSKCIFGGFMYSLANVFCNREHANMVEI